MNRLACVVGCFSAALCCAAFVSYTDREGMELDRGETELDVERMELSSATLEGAVTHKGEPVPYALVIVQSGDQAATASVAKDGTYRVEHAPLGEVQIGVNTEAGRGLMLNDVMAAQQSKTEKPAAKFIDIPQKYRDPSTSGITAIVAHGVNQFDIEIE